MRNIPRFAAIAILFCLCRSTASAQIPMSAGSYSRNFDSLSPTGTSNPWVNNSTLPGWYASKTIGGTDVTIYRADDGGGTAGAIYSFGSTATSERALGSISSGTPGSLIYGLRFTNDTELAQTNITVSYTGEQWRSSSLPTIQTLAFSYQISSEPFSNSFSGSWTSFSPLNFLSPNTNATQSALNGNASSNRTLFSSVTLTGAVVQPGQELFLRWVDVDDTGFDSGLAVDDLVVSFDGSTNEPPPPPPASTNLFSLLHYNVKGNGTTDWSTNTAQVQAIGRQLMYLNADIIAFNEIPYTNTWQMTNWVKAFLPGYSLATNSGTDGFIRSVIASRYPIVRSTRWLDGADLRPFGYTNNSSSVADNFSRDLFEAEIAVPGLPRHLHVFTTHLKATSSQANYAEDSAKRAAEAAAITNFFRTNFFVRFPYDPYTLSGDMNESDTNALVIQRLISPATGVRLTNPQNPVTGSINTYSTSTANPSQRIDYIMPCALLATNIAGAQVFRTDRLNPLPPNLFSNDCKVASDHLPVLMVFSNPYEKPFRIVSISTSNQAVTLNWETIVGGFYNVESSSNLTAWSAIATNLPSTNDLMSWSINPAADRGYFRVRRVP